ncbi:hypothetical protein TYRP_019978 [Tyrophagus putrescentiae]|nr:hypothetical protein TYRP_019978 [Tyrophagus putrescentiae]
MDFSRYYLGDKQESEHTEETHSGNSTDDDLNEGSHSTAIIVICTILGILTLAVIIYFCFCRSDGKAGGGSKSAGKSSKSKKGKSMKSKKSGKKKFLTMRSKH